MQSLQKATKHALARDCAWDLLDGAPPVVWYIRRVMREHRGGLSMPQFRAMCRIANDPKTSLSTVAEHVGLSLPTTSRIVAGLVEKGFLKRSDCPEDRRQCVLCVTTRGQAVLNSAWLAAQESIAGELKHFTPAQLGLVTDAMNVLKEVFGSLRLPRDSALSQNGSVR